MRKSAISITEENNPVADFAILEALALVIDCAIFQINFVPLQVSPISIMVSTALLIFSSGIVCLILRCFSCRSRDCLELECDFHVFANSLTFLLTVPSELFLSLH